MRSYSPGGALNALAAAQEGSIPPTPSAHRLRLGLPGYLILFAPLAFASQRQMQPRNAPSPLVFLPISTHFTATPGITFPLLPSSLVVRDAVHRLSRWISHPTYQAAYTLFTPSDSEQRSHPPYYRGCWHGVSRCFFCRYRQVVRVIAEQGFVPTKRSLRPEGLLPPRGVARSGFPPLPKPLDCCLP